MYNQLHPIMARELLNQLPDNCVDMLFTDPPYCSGSLHSSGRKQTTNYKYTQGTTAAQYPDFDFDNMDQRAWKYWTENWLLQAFRVMKPGGIVVCFIDWRQLGSLIDVVQAAGFTHRGIPVWDKTQGGGRPRNGGFKAQAEYMVWATKGDLLANNIYLPGVFSVPLKKPKQHLTEKPLALAEQVVRLVPPGGLVLDLFAGSGTFLLAAKNAGLNWVGCEIHPAYFSLASERLAG